MSNEPDKFRPFKYDSMQKPGGKEVQPKPGIRLNESSTIGGGTEVEVREASLDYKNRTDLRGLVFKKFKGQGELPRWFLESKLKYTLQQWQKIRQIHDELRKSGKEGFNIPPTVRGVVGKDGIGILMTDMREGGKKDVIDLKRLVFSAEARKVNRKEWDKLRRAVDRDVHIGLSNNIRLIREQPLDEEEPLDILDPWTVIIDKKTGACELALTDIGEFSGAEVDKIFVTDHDKMQKHLDSIEGVIIGEHWDWNEYERRKQRERDEKEKKK
ncbi:hypothetical protein A3A40_01030 [Candidatus Kaiserbacteria bacterium RIFCSPLOWO2_01_FULL_54_20]|uniref:Uncharacterized protein n=1 Tax=Candidatus Kaiserbacteria bacterium RIFCSPLOWO2_01_FULL_54_20 TaxID=1798513 RepID=A0A1F6EIE8_9BACT|nr:MAG: hypothetical protein A3A40_01030 [Candidatus Kaiserbacteria bacterium RIFCSPLOWO2_01_FULL_54_20]